MMEKLIIKIFRLNFNKSFKLNINNKLFLICFFQFGEINLKKNNFWKMEFKIF